jgi:hypothetical protein
MRVAFHDSPYLGCCRLYGHFHGGGGCWDDPETHRLSIERTVAQYPGCWAFSLSSPSLRTLLPFFPERARLGMWFKPFCSFKLGVTVTYAYEPVVFWSSRPRTREQDTVRDWVEAPAVKANITLRKGLTGAKPEAFSYWLFEVLNLEPSDEFVDLFPGSGAVSEAWAKWKRRRELEPAQLELTA